MSLFRIIFYFVASLTAAFVPDPPLQLLSTSSSSSSSNNTTNDPPTNQTLSTPPNPRPKPRPPPPRHISYICNSRAFGADLNTSSCEDAIRRVGNDKTPLLFGLRNTLPSGPRPYDVVLPHRWVSPDGWCTIEPFLMPDKTEATASAEDIAVASFVVEKHCVREQGGPGGIAADIGGDNNLRVILAKYDPSNIRCYGRMPTTSTTLQAVLASCQTILDGMSATDEDLKFGPRSFIREGGVDVGLPLLLISADHRCKITIRTTGMGPGETDTWTWGKFWEVAVALMSVCVWGRGKEGVQTRLGDNGFLYMEIGGPQ